MIVNGALNDSTLAFKLEKATYGSVHRPAEGDGLEATLA